MKNLPNSPRLLALLTASVLTVGVMLHSTPARADKAKNYKYGAVALGVVGAYLLSKGKTVEGAVVLGAGAYTYKKGEDTRKADNNDNYRDRYGYRYDDRDTDRYPAPNPNGDRYGDTNSNNYNDRYYVTPRHRLSDDNSSSRPYRNDDYRNRGRGGDRDNRNSERYNRENPKLRNR